MKICAFFHSYEIYYDIHVLYFIQMNTSISTLHLNIIIWMDCMFWILGESGLGKSTLINSLFLTDLYSADYQGPSHRIQKTVKVGVPPLSKQVQYHCPGHQYTTVYDTGIPLSMILEYHCLSYMYITE